MTEIPVGLANAFVPDLEATGTVSGTAKATGPLDRRRTPTFDLTGSGHRRRARSPTAAFRRSTCASPARWPTARQRSRPPSPISARPRSPQPARSAARSISTSARTTSRSASPTASCRTCRRQGTISGTAKATGTLAAPNAVFDLVGQRAHRRGAVAASGLPPADLRLAGRYDAGTATLRDGDRRASATPRSPPRARSASASISTSPPATCPVALANGFVPGLGAAGTISGTAKATGSLSDPAATFDLAGRRHHDAEAEGLRHARRSRSTRKGRYAARLGDDRDGAGRRRRRVADGVRHGRPARWTSR